MSAHSIMREQLEGELNRERNLVQLIQLLNDSYAPLVSISKLPTIPQLGVHNNVWETFFYSQLFCYFLSL